ncbi:hypothetical protein B0H17DRAFT_662474 [Mycena rosella]|uniref:Uncharacterized protein n=1 Tax=Mycena rosella TaxID=1033263 RepID=A0AAD7BCR5_MYCRO|nr:hypothetical protein B0H17DRAFT_662474 [Mycena rosella]
MSRLNTVRENPLTAGGMNVHSLPLLFLSQLLWRTSCGSKPTASDIAHTMDSTVPPLALICAGPSTALARKSRNNALVLGSSSAPMTGRTLNAVYSYLGEHLERQANRAAHRLGLGPNILAGRIRDHSEAESSESRFWTNSGAHTFELESART